MREIVLTVAGLIIGGFFGVTFMRELSAIGNNINQLAAKANTLGFADATQLKKEAERWHKFQADVERAFLRPNESDMKWQ